MTKEKESERIEKVIKIGTGLDCCWTLQEVKSIPEELRLQLFEKVLEKGTRIDCCFIFKHIKNIPKSVKERLQKRSEE